jgi:hypothetical protein
MEPVGEEEAQLVLLSQKSFVSLFDTVENDSASFEEKTEGVGGGICMAGLRTWALARLGIGRN